ncbi:unnamed protein product [Camellia sinensis]
MFTSFSSSSSSSSSSSDSESNDDKIVTFLGVYEINNSSMILILQSTNRSKKRGGSVVGHKYIRRDRWKGHERLFIDYLANPVYSSVTFQRRFRMRRPLYLQILNAIELHDPYFVQKQDTTYILGLSPLQKMTSIMRILSYGVAADVFDDYIRIGESIAIQSLQHFCNSVIEIFEPEYLRSPTSTDIARLLAIGEVLGFPGMLGSLDCMHWEWKNCPKVVPYVFGIRKCLGT